MDDKECIRGTFSFMPTIYGPKLFDKYTSKKRTKQRTTNVNGEKCQGDILYVQNPIFNNFDLRFRENRSNEYQLLPINSARNVNNDNRNFFKVSATSDELEPINTCRKSRKHGMKARAENRRDSLLIESSDDDYSSVHSSSDLRPAIKSHKNLCNMDDAYNRRTRSARTERYFRRLSRDDGLHGNDISVPTIGAPRRIENPKLHLPQPFHYRNVDNAGNLSPNLLFSNQDNTVMSNPIYKTTKSSTEMLCNKNLKKETIDDQTYAANFDPGRDAVLAYKRNKSPRTIDRVQYVEPRIYNYEESKKIATQNKPSVNPNRIVRRSFSFQNEMPKEYESRNNASISLIKNPNKLSDNHQRNECKWIDSIASPTSTRAANLQSDNFIRQKFNPPKERSDFISGDKNLITNYDNILLKRRSSKDLGKELSELEKMYTSLRLSDDNLLERAEERCVEEFSLKGQSQQALNNESSKNLSSHSSTDSIFEDDLSRRDNQQSSEAHVINDDMAYRKMQTKKMPALSETQNSLSQISYLLASSALVLEKTDYPDFRTKTAREEPNITKDDMVYRNLHYANNVLKVVEPQPPFGIPLRPATPSTNSNYLCSSPVAIKSPPLKFVPQSEPNLITDDLAFRNLRKDAPKSAAVLSDDKPIDVDNVFTFKNEYEKSLSNNDDDKFVKKKRKAVRSLSANLYGLINEVKNLDLNIK